MRSEIMRIYSALISQTKINTGDISLAIQNNLKNVIIIVHSRLMTAMCKAQLETFRTWNYTCP